jgi:hypothetical protein
VTTDVLKLVVLREVLRICDGVAVEVSDPRTIDSAGGAMKLEDLFATLDLDIK